MLGLAAPDLAVVEDFDDVARLARGGVLLLATHSRFDEVLPDLQAAVRAGLSVVSTCEELAWPWLAHREEAAALDALCHDRNVAVLGTGARASVLRHETAKSP